MELKKCRDCGVPLYLSRNYRWKEGGYILAARDPDSRMVFEEADFYGFIWEELERLLGILAPEVISRTQKLVLRDYMDGHILYGWRKWAIRMLPLRPFIAGVIRQSTAFGLGRFEYVDHRKGKYLVLRVRKPFHLPTIAEALREMMVSLRGTDYELAWTKEDGGYVINLLSRPGRRPLPLDKENLMTLRRAKTEVMGGPVPEGGRTQERCPSCGLPAGLSQLEWREEEGTVVFKPTGARYVFVTSHVFPGVVKELERLTGRDLSSLVIELSRIYHRHSLRSVRLGSRGGTYEALARYSEAAGWGKVLDYSHGPGYLEVRLANPYHVPRLLGRFAAVFERLEGQEAEVSWESEGPRLIRALFRAA